MRARNPSISPPGVVRDILLPLPGHGPSAVSQQSLGGAGAEGPPWLTRGAPGGKHDVPEERPMRTSAIPSASTPVMSMVSTSASGGAHNGGLGAAAPTTVVSSTHVNGASAPARPNSARTSKEMRPFTTGKLLSQILREQRAKFASEAESFDDSDDSRDSKQSWPNYNVESRARCNYLQMRSRRERSGHRAGLRRGTRRAGRGAPANAAKTSSCVGGLESAGGAGRDLLIAGGAGNAVGAGVLSSGGTGSESQI